MGKRNRRGWAPKQGLVVTFENTVKANEFSLTKTRQNPISFPRPNRIAVSQANPIQLTLNLLKGNWEAAGTVLFVSFQKKCTLGPATLLRGRPDQPMQQHCWGTAS